MSNATKAITNSRLFLAGISFFEFTPARKRFDFQRLYSQPVDRTTGVICDQIVTLVNPVPRQGYPEKLRRIRYRDAQTDQRLVFLTNNFTLPPLTIAQLYRGRWQVELFFKWIKQHLRIKNFYGTSENALRTQIWIAISVYVLVAIVKKELHLEGSLYRMLQICSVTLRENPYFTGSFFSGRSNRLGPSMQTTDSVQLTLGQY